MSGRLSRERREGCGHGVPEGGRLAGEVFHGSESDMIPLGTFTAWPFSLSIFLPLGVGV